MKNTKKILMLSAFLMTNIKSLSADTIRTLNQHNDNVMRHARAYSQISSQQSMPAQRPIMHIMSHEINIEGKPNQAYPSSPVSRYKKTGEIASPQNMQQQRRQSLPSYLMQAPIQQNAQIQNMAAPISSASKQKRPRIFSSSPYMMAGIYQPNQQRAVQHVQQGVMNLNMKPPQDDVRINRFQQRSQSLPNHIEASPDALAQYHASQRGNNMMGVEMEFKRYGAQQREQASHVRTQTDAERARAQSMQHRLNVAPF